MSDYFCSSSGFHGGLLQGEHSVAVRKGPGLQVIMGLWGLDAALTLWSTLVYTVMVL